MGHAEDMTKPAPARRLWMVSDIIHIQVLWSSSSFEMTFGQYILKRRRHLVWKTSSFLRCHKCLPAFWSIPEVAEDVAIEDPDLSVDLKSSGSPYGFQHGKSLVGFADLGLVCFCQSPVVVTLLPSYMNSSTSSSDLFFTSFLLQLAVFIRRT